jgi:serine/threonine-protein kinase
VIGKTIAHYEITGHLGKGGMGEVYRARDTKLRREVAIKVLPADLLRDAERVARFQREARTLASLNHPQIAGLYGVEEDHGQRFLVMELAEGEDLSRRIENGPLPLDDALDIARQIALGLEAAHAKGIVHRDLKPANIKVSTDGEVKILDFGLARAFQGETVDEGELENSPTITAAMTQQGVVLGTAAYMSPEQAKGRTVDRRADVWSFGVILWEMVTGRRLFEEETTSEVLAAVLRADIPWDDLPDDLPVGVRRLLERCLERDPRSRLQDIGEARIRLDRWKGDPTSLHESLVSGVTIAGTPRWRGAVPWAIAAVIAIVAVWGWVQPHSGTRTEAQSLAFQIRLQGGDSTTDAPVAGGDAKISPRGNLLAYQFGGSLWLRWLDDFDVRKVEGSQNVQTFDFSPDGRWVAFVARGTLFRASISGGAPTAVCEVTVPRGIAWVNEDTIVFPMDYAAGLSAVSVETGKTRTLTTLDESRGERSHRWPRALPDGKSLLMVCQFWGHDYDESDIQVVDLETGERKTVYEGGSYPIYAHSHHLLFARDTTVFAVEFDPTRHTTQGLPVPVLIDVQTSVGDQATDDGSAAFDVSPQGLLLYRTARSGLDQTRVADFDFVTGRAEPFGGIGRNVQMAASPDGAWLAVTRIEEGGSNIYLYDLSTRTEHRFTRQRGLNNSACWGPDSRSIYWTHASGDGKYWIFRQPIDGSAPVDTIAGTRNSLGATGASSDGHWLLVSAFNDRSAWDVELVDLQAGTGEGVPLVDGPASQLMARFSPDQKWMTYFNSESGDFRLELRRFPDTGAVWQVTPGMTQLEGAAFWTSDGKSILMRQNGDILSIPVELQGETVRIGKARKIALDGLLSTGDPTNFAVRHDQQGVYGFYAGAIVKGSESTYVVRTNWFDDLRARVDEGR